MRHTAVELTGVQLLTGSMAMLVWYLGLLHNVCNAPALCSRSIWNLQKLCVLLGCGSIRECLPVNKHLNGNR